MGSASVEVVLSEPSILGVSNLVLTGSCGASYDYDLGSAKILTEASANNPGVIRYYGDTGAGPYYPDAALLKTADELGLGYAAMLSSDAFYGFGCLPDEQKKPVYVGGRMQYEPEGFREFRELYESASTYLIDMEVAHVYALAALFEMRAIAIKGVSN